MSSNLLGIIFPYIITSSNSSYIFTLLLSSIISLLLILLYIKLINKNINKSKLLLIINLLITSYLFYRFTVFVSNEYLTQTPIILISLLLFLPIIVSSFKNIDVIIRCSSIIIIISFILLLLSNLSLINKIDINFLKQISFKPLIVIKDSIIISILSTSPIFNTLLVKEHINIDKKHIITSYIITHLLLIITTVIIIGTLGLNISSIYRYPSYIVLKNINILNFIKNVQNLSVVFWTMIFTFTICFNIKCIEASFNKKYKLIILPLIFILSFTFIKIDTLINKNGLLYTYIPFILSLLLILTLLTSIKKK